ncbi:MAG: IclR family transcriptional regulator [Synergistaceae bacterium]|jgi:DNA-binding IclR family transcriptional regulator|nr:IclR family transcriptional regulator [Synergistaceae bacterium]
MKEDIVRAVERAFAVLECFSLDEPKLTLNQITEKLGLPASTTLRILTTLVSLSVLKRSSDKTYSLGSRVYFLGAVAQAHDKRHQVVLPYMTELRDDIKEAVSLYGVEGEYRVCYEHVPSLLTMRCVVRVGDRFELWAGASGKVLLAYAPEDIVTRETRKLAPITSATIVNKEKFLEELVIIRGQDYSISHGEREEGIISIAVPILDWRGNALYALSLAGPALRFTEERALTLIPRIQRICVEISRRLLA